LRVLSLFTPALVSHHCLSATRSLLNLKTGKYLTCHIGSQTLSQRDLAQIQFIYAREPAAHYLLRHDSHIEPWPEQLLEDYREQLILVISACKPGMSPCLHYVHN
jgi:hypothetical protein